MNTLPWIITDCEVALWAAWKDGTPMNGPGTGRGKQEPLFQGFSTISITENFEPSRTTGHCWTDAEAPSSVSYQITVEFPDGAVADHYARTTAGLHHGGFRILTVRFVDETSGLWTLLSFFYVTPSSDSISEKGQVITRSTSLKASWKQERIGASTAPEMHPIVLGEVDWTCGPHRITALTYDPTTEAWTSLPRNEIGQNNGRYVSISPISQDPDSDVFLTAYLPRITPAPTSGEKLPSSRILWQNTTILLLGNQNSINHHGIILRAGHNLQTIGTVEPTLTIPQDRVLDEPVITFRYLRRIYATIAHGIIAIPRLLENQAPPPSHDPAFRLAIPGPANPATGHSGLTILPNGAWLDGTLITHP